MKKFLTLLSTLIPTLYLHAQNTYPFPATGSVGIGTQTPQEQLHLTQNLFINGANNNGIRLQKAAGYSFWIYPSSSGVLSFGGVGTAPTSGPLNINNSGNVGIGTANPAGLLHLQGTGATLHLTTPDPTAISSVAAIRGNNGTWLFGYAGASGAEDVSIGTRDGTGTRTLILAAGGLERMKILANGNVGIGITSPAYKLDVNGTAYVSGSTISAGQVTAMNGTRLKATSGNGVQITGAAGIGIRGVGTNTTAGYAAIQTAYDNVNFLCPLTLQDQGGNVLIGKTTQTNANYKLDVNGIVRANKLVVNTNGADFVFEKGYQLPSLDSLEQYVKANQHLPGIAPAADMQKEGVEVGEQQTKLLQKIEELTLYLIEEHKKQETLIKTVEEQKMQIQLLLEHIKNSAAKP